MKNWQQTLNYALTAASIIIILLGFLLALSSMTMEKRTKRFFTVFFLTMLLYLGSSLTGQTVNILLGNSSADQPLLFFESLFSSMLMPMLTGYLLSCCGERLRGSRVLYCMLGLWAAYFILLMITQYTTAIYYYDDEYVYHRGPMYPLLLALPVASMAVNLFALLRRRKLLTRKQFVAFLLFFLLPMLGMLAQMLLFGIRFIVFASALSAVAMFVFMLSNEAEQFYLQKEENARQRASISVLQMRPHFIYNTMTSVYYLCRQDPEKAQQVILDFTSYLRKNFTAIAREGTIPFDEELEHTRAYLGVELVRFADRLTVAFDTPYTRFRVPPLTLQPIVENAVKHGVDPELAPLHIDVSAGAVEGGSLITVADTGPGFAAADDNAPHIALANIQERLKMMCGGRLEIAPRAGGGTVVKVFVPDIYPPPEK